MYASYFGLSAEPFSLTPDPAYLYLGPEHREAMAAVRYGLADRRGFITLVGEVGTGKTTLLYSILGQLGEDVQAAYVAYTTQSFEDLLIAMLRDLQVPIVGSTKRELLEALNQHLLRRADAGQTTALVVDEAQNLSDQAFEELRLLSNFETYSTKLVQIVLVGQPELRERLRQAQLRQLWERVSVRASIRPLSRSQIVEYIDHRLRRVGGASARLFDPQALKLIVRRTGGIPRRANILCHNALLFAYGRELRQVTPGIAREVIAEMDDRVYERPSLRIMRWAALAAGLAVAVSAVGWVGGLGGSDEAPAPPPAVAPNHGRIDPAPPAPERKAVAPARPPAEAAEERAAPDREAEDREAEGPGEAERPAAARPEPSPREEPSGEHLTAPSHPTGDDEMDDDRPPARPSEPAASLGAPHPAADHAEGLASPDHQSKVVSLVVPPGANLVSLARGVYGRRLQTKAIPALFAEVRRLNPQVTNVDLIMAGDEIRFPVPSLDPELPSGGLP